MAIDRAVWIGLRPRSDRRVVVEALDLDEDVAFGLDRLVQSGSDWTAYLKGVAWSLQEGGLRLKGWDGVLTGDVPQGAGLSSSAAMELAAARAFAVAAGLAWRPVEMAKLCQRAENEWVGVRCGIMDQMISALGKAGQAVLIDCRSLETRPVPLPPDVVVLVLDTGTRRGLVESAYNDRREACETAATFFGVQALRDVRAEEIEEAGPGLDERLKRRARHVVTENARTLEACEALRGCDAERLGRLMDASHRSLRDDFEVSSEALNAMVCCARRHSACYGARMTGAGFGGCAVALVGESEAGDLKGKTEACYQVATGLTPTIYVCRAADGAAVVAG
jgi:galactokinase